MDADWLIEILMYLLMSLDLHDVVAVFDGDGSSFGVHDVGCQRRCARSSRSPPNRP